MSSKTFKRVLSVLAVFTAVFAVLSVKTQAATNEDVRPIVYDAEYYITTAKDLQDAYIREDGSVDEEGLYGQFVVYGIAEGRKGSPSFDIKYYMEANPDLAKEFGATNYARGYQHFLEYGLYEGRTGCNLYDNACYKANNPDLVTAYGNANEMYYVHFVLFGQGEARKACDWFDVKCYVNSNADLKKEFGTNWKAGYKHYAFFGNSENRIVAHTWENGVCATCGETATVTGHTHNYVVDEVKTIPATCTTDGITVEKCSVCGEEKETRVTALGHDYSVEATEEQLAARNLHRATCEVDGVVTNACSRCGTLDMQNIQNETAKGHEWVNFRAVTDEDIKADKALSKKQYVKECTKCGEKLGMTIIEAFEDPSIAELEVDGSNVAFANKAKNLTVPAGTTRTVKGRLQLKNGGVLTVAGNLEIESGIYVGNSDTDAKHVKLVGDGNVTYLSATGRKINWASGIDYISVIKLTANVNHDSSSSSSGEKAPVKLKTSTNKIFDLNGHKISSGDNNAPAVEIIRDDTNTNTKASVITMKNGTIEGTERAIRTTGNLVIEDCEVKASTGYGVFAKGPVSNTSSEDKITVDLKNVDMNCSTFCVATNAENDNVDLTLTDVTAYTSNTQAAAMYLPAKGNTVISGGSFTGGSAIEVIASNLEIKDGTKLEGTRTPYDTNAATTIGATGANGSALLITSRGGQYTEKEDVIKVVIADDVEFRYAAKDKAHNVEFTESTNESIKNGASFDITWDGHDWKDVYQNVPNNSTINYVMFNGEKVVNK